MLPRILLLGLASLWVSCSFAQEKCSLPELDAAPANDPSCLFYAGTANFRAKDYSLAFEKWSQLVALPELPKDREHLRTSALNNLGYLLYMGWGVSSDRIEALRLWERAYRAGHEEATYHLCHYFGEQREPEYKPALALEYCREALRRYAEKSELERDRRQIVEILKRYVARLEAR